MAGSLSVVGLLHELWAVFFADPCRVFRSLPWLRSGDAEVGSGAAAILSVSHVWQSLDLRGSHHRSTKPIKKMPYDDAVRCCPTDDADRF